MYKSIKWNFFNLMQEKFVDFVGRSAFDIKKSAKRRFSKDI
jgi:hypothetical protein